MFTLLTVLIAALAGGQITETIHHGSIFAGWRQRARAWQQSRHKALSLAGELIECPFCLSHWACLAMTAWMLWLPFGSPWHVVPAALAAVRVSQLLNDLTHSWTRSPASDGFQEVSVSLNESLQAHPDTERYDQPSSQ